LVIALPSWLWREPAGIAVGYARRAAVDQRERGNRAERAERGERGGGQERQPEAGGQCGCGGHARGEGSGGLRGGDGGAQGQPERAADLLGATQPAPTMRRMRSRLEKRDGCPARGRRDRRPGMAGTA
jgi:hypothetical protein